MVGVPHSPLPTSLPTVSAPGLNTPFPQAVAIAVAEVADIPRFAHSEVSFPRLFEVYFPFL